MPTLREEALRRYFGKLIKHDKKPFVVWQNDRTGKSNRLTGKDMEIWKEMNGGKRKEKRKSVRKSKRRNSKRRKRRNSKSKRSKSKSKSKSKRSKSKSKRSKSKSKSKRSKSKSRSPHSKRCHKLLQDKIKINMKEYEKGRYSSRGQALAVSYSQTKKRHPSCKKSFK